MVNFCNPMFFHTTIWSWTMVQHQGSGWDQITHFLVFHDNWTTKNLAVAFGWVLQVLRRPFISHNGSRPYVGSEVIGKVCQETINHGYATSVTVAYTICVEGIKGFLCQTKLENLMNVYTSKRSTYMKRAIVTWLWNFFLPEFVSDLGITESWGLD